MAKITRATLKQFGSTGTTGYFGKFGSQAAGAPVTTKDVATIQSLTAWLNGFQDALTLNTKAPYLEDMNSLFYVMAYMQAYSLQEGIAEYDAGTTYFIGSIVKKTGTFELYGSIVNTNVGNALPSAVSDSKWQYLGNVGDVVRTQNGVFVNRGDPAAVDFTEATITIDGTWHDMDLSAICPVGAKTVLLRVLVLRNAAPNSSYGFYMKKKGQTNDINVGAMYYQVNGIGLTQEMTISLDANRFVEYKAQVAYDVLHITVAGWWM